MIGIEKSTNTIINESCSFREDEYRYPVDEIIAPVIQLLNEKGYKTLYCCSGHDGASIEIAAEEYKDTYEDILEEYSQNGCTVLGYSTSVIEGSNIITIKYIENAASDNRAYIAFAVKLDDDFKKSVESLGWTVDPPSDYINPDIKDTIRYIFNYGHTHGDIPYYERLNDRIEVFKELYRSITYYDDYKEE